MLDGDTLVVVYAATDPYTHRYDLDIIAEIRAQLGDDAVAVISTEPLPEEYGDAVVLPGLDGLDDAQVALAYVGVRAIPRAVHRAGNTARHRTIHFHPARSAASCGASRSIP